MSSIEFGSGFVPAFHTHDDSADVGLLEFASWAEWPNNLVASACVTKVHAATFGAPARPGRVVTNGLFLGVAVCLLLPPQARRPRSRRRPSRRAYAWDLPSDASAGNRAEALITVT